MKKKRIDELLERYRNGTCTDEERRLLDRHFLAYFDTLQASPSKEQLELAYEKGYRAIRSAIATNRMTEQRARKLRWISYAAAVVLLMVFVGVWQLRRFSDQVPTDRQTMTTTDRIQPGGNKAILRLDNGESIVLSEDQAEIRMFDNRIVYADGNQLPVDQFPEKAGKYTLEVPKGGMYKLLLPDGTVIWLNAASQVTYPADFLRDTIRKIDLEGEAFFEIAADKTKPFKIRTANATVRVLGTDLNISAYKGDTEGQITLVNGVVNINDNTTLKPGQQAIVDQAGGVQVHAVDVDKFVAWKDGKFVFVSEHLDGVMRKLSRWYNVTVEYEGSVADVTFSGAVSRFDDIHKVLNMITYTSGVQFKIIGRRVIVMP